ncbi:MAG: hypothetical protein LBS21_04535 [Clostridiales bacterium]|jgi:uncharacterized protein YukE|nr:hypothetical protein [Clostridiales bacterium]
MASIEFDFARAKEFQGKLDTTMTSVIGELTKMETKVGGCREWWKGGSEEGFIQNFSKTKKVIEKKLNECAKEYKKLVDEVKKVKEQEERDMQQALKQ